MMGAGAATIGGIALSDIATDAAIGAAIGGVGAGITGGNVLEGAALGGVGGGIGSFAGPALGSALDIGTTGGDILAGAALGAGGSAITGGNPLVGAALGGAGGAIQGFTAPTTATGATVPGANAVTQGGGLSAAAPSTALTAPPPALAAEGGSFSDMTAGGGLGSAGGGFGGTSGAAIDSSGLSNVATSLGGAGPSNVASDLPASFSVDGGAGLLNTNGGSLANPNATLADITGAGAKPPSTFDQFISNVGSGNVGGALGNIGTAAANNPGVVLGGLGLGYQALTQPSVPKAAQAPAITADQLALARQATAGSAALEAPLTTGVLPPGAQSAIDQATKAAKARVISNYAARGMDTDPATNASLAQDLNAIDQQAAGQVFQYADQLYQQGLSQAQISESLYNAILQNTTAQNKTMNDAISNFVSAAAGGGKPSIIVNTGGAAPQAA